MIIRADGDRFPVPSRVPNRARATRRRTTNIFFPGARVESSTRDLGALGRDLGALGRDIETRHLSTRHYEGKIQKAFDALVASRAPLRSALYTRGSFTTIVVHRASCAHPSETLPSVLLENAFVPRSNASASHALAAFRMASDTLSPASTLFS